MLSEIRKDHTGNVTTLVAIVGFFIVFLIGGALDTMFVFQQKSSLKTLADEAALATAQQLIVSSKDESTLRASVVSYISERVPDRQLQVGSSINFENSTVTVTLAEEAVTHFPTPIRMVDRVQVSSTAQSSSESGNVCMISLSGSANEAIDIRTGSSFYGPQCSVYSNSTASSALKVYNSPRFSAELVCVAGGISGRLPSTDERKVITDCPPLDDPLLSRAIPSVGACDHNKLTVTGSETLTPGVYCGGLKIDGGDVSLLPGEYIIKDGSLRVTNGGELTGSYVGFFFTGSNAVLNLDPDSHISLTAPKTGTMAGLLFFAPGINAYGASIGPSIKFGTKHRIRSNDARRLVGTIYLPGGNLTIDGNNPIADQSEYTVIIASTVEVLPGPNLVLRTDYDLSDIPVPMGVGPVENVNIRLISPGVKPPSDDDDEDDDDEDDDDEDASPTLRTLRR